MIALLRKESEALAPYWFAFGVLWAVNIASGLWDSDFVLETLGERFSNGESNAGTLWLLSFLLGHGAVAHELRDGHVEFLDALPIGRGSVYLAKLVAAVLPVVALVAGSLAMDLGWTALSRPPVSSSPLVPLLVEHLVMLASGIAGLGAGMLLSWIGPLAWGVVGLCFLVGMCAGTLYPPVLGWLPMVGSLGGLEWEGGSASHPIAPPLSLALSGLVGIALSGLLFLGPGRILTERGSQAVAAVRVGLLGCFGLLVMPLGLLFGLMFLLGHGSELLYGTRAMPSAAQGFRILYAPGDEAEADGVAQIADAISARVSERLGGSRLPRLDIELLGAPQNHLGVFTGGKIRLARTADTATLTHELTHAHAYALSGPGGWIHQGSTHFFEEGLADWVEAGISGRSQVPIVVGAIGATGQARFEDLVERERHLARHDIRQSYALGAAFVDALADAAGPEALPCVLSGLGAVGDRAVAGLALWYALADRCGFDLDVVQDRWVERLDRAKERLGPLPRLRAAVRPADAFEPLRIELRDEDALGWMLLCGFRDGPEAPVHRWVYLPAAGSSCPVPVAGLSGHSFQYQVGYRIPDSLGDEVEEGLQDVYLEWTDARRE